MPLRHATDARAGAGVHGRAEWICAAHRGTSARNLRLFAQSEKGAVSCQLGKLCWENEIPALRHTAAPCKPSAAAYRGCMSPPSAPITYLAQIDYRDDRRIFGIRQEDRFSHVYVIGKTGTGKSTLMEKMALQDLESGRGFALIDPHGDLVERVAARAVPSRGADVIYLNASDPTQPWGYNPLR